MSFNDAVVIAKKNFPDLQIKYKDQSLFMKVLGLLLFFNSGFLTKYTTTIGSTIYFVNDIYIKLRPNSALVVLLHELVHVKDSKKHFLGFFGFLYLFPQILVLLAIPLLLISWKLALLALIFAAPLPAYFRMIFEKRAYMASLYALHALGNKMNYDPKLDDCKNNYLLCFNGASYYFMWIFGGIDKDLTSAILDIRAGKRPFEDPIFDILDEIIIAF